MLVLNSELTVSLSVSEVIIEVRVGTPATTYNIRRNILCKSSESLRARQKAEWDTGDAAVDLQHDDPAAFGLYANWLYTGTLPSRAPISSADVVHEAEFVLVATAYVLGESVMDVTFQDNVIDPIRAKIRGPKGSVVWHVAREMVHILYEVSAREYKPHLTHRWLIPSCLAGHSGGFPSSVVHA